jgi:hypothetical protein
MKKFFYQLFNDDNSINEKSVIGFSSFIVMVIYSFADIVTDLFGKPVTISEFIYNSFLIMALGAFSIGSIDKYVNKKDNTN